ncbi:MAG: glycosyl hydrolase [Vicinamibacteria bacterium]
MHSPSRVSHSILTLLVALLICSADFTAAQPPAANRPAAQAGPFGVLRWRNLGPLRGGRSIAAEGSVARPNEYYFGASGGGLWKTNDGGTTWNPTTDGKINSSSVGAIGIAPSNPDIDYIGMGETEIRGNIAQGDGVYKTTDGGKTWKHIGLEDTLAIAKVRVHPKDPDLVYVAAFGHPAGPNDERGVFRSKDGGTTWKKILFRDNKTGAIELILDPGNPQVIYVAMWEAGRTSHGMTSGGPGSGIFKSTDGGDHFTEISRNPGLPKGVLGKIGLSVSAVDSNRVYAQVEAEDGGFFMSDDAGANWKLINAKRDLRQRAFYYSRVYADPKVKDTVYVLNVGFNKSIDAGKTWTTLRPPHGDNHDMWIAPNDSSRMIEANDGGANVSVNGGETWTDQDFATAQFYHVTSTTDVPYHVCGAQQDNSTACVSSENSAGGFGGRVAPIFYSAGGGESGYIASNPKDPNIFYAGSYGGLITRFDRRTDQSREINPYPDNPMGYTSADIAERFQWTFPIVFSPQDSNVLYVSSQHLWKTTNEGQSWTKISPDLTRHDPQTLGPSGGPITKDHTGVETYATIFSIAPSPHDANVIWTGSDDGYVFVTKDGGKTWTNVTPKDLPDFARISLVEASPYRAGSAYMAANRYGRDDFAPYAYRTDDYGQTWTKIIKGVEPRDFVRAIREDIKREKMLYLGTENGIYVSFDNGDNWQSLRQNLPVTPVHDIAVEQRDLLIATHGRALYVMDNIASLRQLNDQVKAEAFHLFKPEPARRGLDANVSFDYSLKAGAQKVTIEVMDAKGLTIKTFTGVPEPADKKPEPPPGDGEFRRPQDPKPAVIPGTHRLNWDMRYPGSVDFPGLIMWAASPRGPVAPPGAYTVRLNVDGASQTQPFVIKREETLLKDITDADLQARFDLAIQVRNKASQANEAILLIRGITGQVDARIKQLDTGKKPSSVLLTARAFNAKLGAVESEIYQVKNQSSQDPLNFPIKLNNKIAALQGVIESADAKPTDQSREVFKMLSDKLDVQLGQMDAIIKNDLPKLVILLQKKKLESVTVTPLKIDVK